MTDEELMLAVCNGDQSAYQTLVRQHLKPISHYAYRILGNRRDTEDITQEVFLKMWINAANWNPEKSKLTTWLHRIAHNLCIDHLRKHSKTQVRADIDDTHSELLSAEHKGDDVEQAQLSAALNEAIARLPENQRSALMLCHYAGFSNRDAADIMNISVKALESNISRARHNLRNWLEEHKQTTSNKAGKVTRKLRGDAETLG